MATVVKVLGRQGNRLNIARRECSCEVKLPFGLRFTDGGKMHRVHVCPQCERLHGYEDIRKGTLLRSQVVFAPGLPLLSKALELKAGQRWVTLHPDAENPENYVHVLIQEHPDGTASVIRGAEGKLNYLRLTKLKSPEDWQESGKRLAEERERRRKEREAAMTEEERQTTHDVEAGILARKELEDAKYVSQVMEAHGIGESDWKLEEKTLVALPGKSREMAEKQHLRKMVTVANKLVDRTRKDLLDAHDRLAEAELGDMPLGDVGIERPLEGKGSGYIAAVENAAEAAGLSVRQKIAEKEDISWRGFLDRSDGDPLKAAEKLAAVQRLHAALREVREPIKELRTAGLLDRPLKPELPPTEKIADILVAQKQHTDYERQYRQVKGEIEEHGVPKAALEVVTELRPEEVEEIIRAAAAKPLDEEAAKDKVAEELAEDAMQRAAERLLATADKEEALQPLRKYVTMGHYDSLNRSCLAATRTPLPLGRLQADILGPEASAQVLAAHLRETLSDTDYRAALHGVANYHRNYQRQASEQALQSYASTKQQADELSERPISDIGSLVEAQVANADRIDLVDEARETLGVALGRLEATAALVQALELQHARKGVPEELRVPLGAISNQQAIAQARVLGLSHPVMEEMEPGVEPDYRIDSDGVNKFLTILPNGAAKLVTKPDRELAEKHALATEIKSGRRDQRHWLPAGIVSRPQSTFEDPEKRAVQFSEPLELRPKMRYAEVNRGLKHYIARRLADGQDPESLRSDLLSAEFTADLPDDLLGDGGGSYYKALSDLGWFTYNQVENKSPEGLEAIAEHAVEEYEREHGASEEVAALNSQSIPLKDSPVCYEALYRAVAAHPEARVAFKALSELTPEERGLIQRFFYRVMTEEKSPQEEAEEKRLTARPTQAPARQEALWAEQEVPAETTEARKPAKPGRETPWTRYVKAQGSVQHAYESVQDVMRGAVSAQFAKHMGGILGRELKTGNKRIANWDDHLLGLVSPERQQQLLEARQAEMARKHARVATRARGKFATEERLGIRRERAEALDRAIRGAALSLFKEKPLPAIERVTIGARAEKQLQSIFPYVAQNFEVDRPVDIPHDVNMSEGEMVKQQRAVKLIEGLKRLSLNLGVGTGKTLVALGSFSDLQARGAVNRAIFAVPASLTAQFGCVRGDTELCDPIRGLTMTFEEWLLSGLRPFVWTRAAGGQVTIELASRPFLKGLDRMYRVETDDGASIVVTAKHRFLTPKGWRPLCELPVGSLVSCAVALKRATSDAHGGSRATGDYRSGCHPFGHYGDERAHPAPDNGQRAFPLSGGARDSNPVNLPEGGPAQTTRCSQQNAESDLPSSCLPFRPCDGWHCRVLERRASSGEAEPHPRLRRYPKCGLSPNTTAPAQPTLATARRSTRTQVACARSGGVSAFDEGRSLVLSQSNEPAKIAISLLERSGGGRSHLWNEVDDQCAEPRKAQEPSPDEPSSSDSSRSAVTSKCRFDPRQPNPAVADPGRRRILGDLAESVPIQASAAEACAVQGRIGAPSKPATFPGCGSASMPFHQPVSSVGSCTQYSTIRNISEVGLALVFDIAVARTHNYWAGGFWNHNSEALRFYEPGRFKWFADPTASAEDRRAAYTDPDRQICVVTHQALRDDLVWAVGQDRFGGNVRKAEDWMRAAPEDERRHEVRAAAEKQGWKWDMCLPYEAPVAMADGTTRRIGDLVESRSSDPVLSLNLQSGRLEAKSVSDWLRLECPHPQLYRILAGEASVICTGDHKIWTLGRGYVRACEVRVGDRLLALQPTDSLLELEHDTLNRGDRNGSEGYVGRNASGRCLDGPERCRDAASNDQALSRARGLSIPQVRSTEINMPICAEVRQERGMGRRPLGLSDELPGLVAAVPGDDVARREASDCRRREGSLDPGGTGLLVYGRRFAVERVCHTQHTQVFAGRSTEAAILDPPTVRDRGSGTLRPKARPVLYGDAQRGDAPVCGTSESPRAGVHEIQAECAECGVAAVHSANPGGPAGTTVRDLRSAVCLSAGLRLSGMQADQEGLRQPALVRRARCRDLGENSRGASAESRRGNVRGVQESIPPHQSPPCTHVLGGMSSGVETPSGPGMVLPELRCHEAPVTSVEFTDAPAFVYDITVEENHNFFGYGLLVSNCLVDEGQDILRRLHKADSLMQHAIDALSYHTPYYIYSTADPVKNDWSEVHDVLAKVAPDRYPAASREEFHRRYGIDCLQTQQALRQEMHPFAYAERIPLGIVASRRQEPVQLSAPEQSEYDGVLQAYRTAQTARRAGKVDDAVPALRQMNPRAFEGKNEAEQRTEAGRMLQFLSAARDSALDRIVNAGSVRGAGVRIPAKLETLHAFVQSRIAEKGAGLVFAHSIEAQNQIAGYLKSKGIKVGTLSGSDPGAKRERTRQDFQAGKFDVLCLSDAGSTGLNLQRAAFCCNFDSPYTAKTYEQRIGRMERLGQTNPDMKVLDLVTTTPYERGRRRLLERKGKLREALTAPYEMLDDTDLGREIAEARSSEIEKAVLKAA